MHFGPSSGSDLGRVNVKAPASDNVRVFLEGRFFGTAPITIYSVPKGDYILEGTFPDGKTVSKPVSVLENDEAVIDLTGAHAALEAPSKGGGMFSNKEISESRMTAMKAFAIGGAAALVVGITFGQERATQVDAEHRIPVDCCHPEQQIVSGDTGIVDQDRGIAEFGDDHIDGCGDRILVTHVDTDGERFPAAIDDGLHGAVAVLRVQVQNSDNMAVFGQPDGRCRAYAAGRAGHDRNALFVHDFSFWEMDFMCDVIFTSAAR